jgi:hypothetical protein
MKHNNLSQMTCERYLEENDNMTSAITSVDVGEALIMEAKEAAMAVAQ